MTSSSFPEGRHPLQFCFPDFSVGRNLTVQTLSVNRLLSWREAIEKTLHAFLPTKPGEHPGVLPGEAGQLRQQNQCAGRSIVQGIGPSAIPGSTTVRQHDARTLLPLFVGSQVDAAQVHGRGNSFQKRQRPVGLAEGDRVIQQEPQVSAAARRAGGEGKAEPTVKQEVKEYLEAVRFLVVEIQHGPRGAPDLAAFDAGHDAHRARPGQGRWLKVNFEVLAGDPRANQADALRLPGTGWDRTEMLSRVARPGCQKDVRQRFLGEGNHRLILKGPNHIRSTKILSGCQHGLQGWLNRRSEEQP